MRIGLCILASILFFSCGKDKNSLTIEANDPNLLLVNGTWFYPKEKPLTGVIKDHYADGTLKFLYRLDHGKQQGFSETWHPDGKSESLRWYSKGEKDSVHTGWWLNGNKKFEYHFNNGNYHGLFTEWYQSGKIIQEIIYDNGKEVSGKGWRENGKLYMSFVVKNGRRYGLFNANLCYSLSKENMK